MTEHKSRRKAVTVTDIARGCGVSRATVSLVLPVIYPDALK
jgi:DNA-binding MurR/RpiR family transcriptional regulator